MISRLSSWAVDAKSDNLQKGDEPAGNSFSLEDRVEIGRMCKRLLFPFHSALLFSVRVIDFGRLLHLKEKGFTQQLVPYVSRVVTPENIVLIASDR